MDDDEDTPPVLHKFTVVGHMVNHGYQMSKYLVTKLHKSVPNYYQAPEIRPMFDLQWDEYILKMKRRHGGQLWSLTNNVAVFFDDQFIGDDEDLLTYLTTAYKINLTFNWQTLGIQEVNNQLMSITSRYRQLVYLTVAIDRKIIGSMLFELYNDLVPNTCENFIKKCENIGEKGYAGKKIHRIVKGSWIQCAGWCWDAQDQRCENYKVPHDRRGVLGMCNAGRHRDNTAQFFISLDPAQWMSYRYVAFGQLLQGNYILKQIENVATKNEQPLLNIEIIRAGEFKMYPSKDETDLISPQVFRTLDFQEDLQNIFVSEPPSLFDLSKYQQGMYCMHTDLKSHMPFVYLPDLLMKYMEEIEEPQEGDHEQDSSTPLTPCSEYQPVFQSSSSNNSLVTL
ncbi:unnamed protein product [Brassicogethes aeneus]|uniref:PPIase cyclophilin-type domain-containing protein n=1 Tax=Brassicogethes aeneus TaxID=1431903 RepID=A0A9P0BH06_BRAAE|nr:unnamed protein product [Brassicogethes aeneus]